MAAGAEGFYLGGIVDPATGEAHRGAGALRPGRSHHPRGHRRHDRVRARPAWGVIFLEEALRAGIPTLILDPKGDMTNLLLTFPGLSPAEFRPWVDEAAARRDGKTPEEAAADAAGAWSKGLESWGLGKTDVASLRSAAEFTIYTPGSSAGVPLDVLGSLAAPTDFATGSGEAYRDEIEGLVSGLLGLAGIEADPLASREHILVANLVERAWAEGTDLTLEDLIARVHRPPLRKLGVFEIDTFFPEKDRLALAMRLNNLVASPSFAAWRSGPPLDIPSMLWTPEGKPRAAIVYLAHLSDAERQFAVTLALSRLVTWMRSQSGSSDLRVLVYMDEVFGFVPPTAMPPAKKPILTLLKQARAFGVGVLLATQNPVDLDYKAMSNAGTWCIGRLQTERDKARILEALQSAAGDRDLAASRRPGLGPGEAPVPAAQHPRQGTGPLHHPLGHVLPARAAYPGSGRPTHRRRPAARRRRRRRAAAPEVSAPADDQIALAPRVASAVPVYHLDPAAGWAEMVGARRGGTRLAAALAARAHLTFDDAAAGVRHVEEWEAVFHPLGERFDPAAAVAVDYDARDFLAAAPAGAAYLLPAADLADKAFFTAAARALKDHLVRARTLEVTRNRALKLYSRVGESPPSSPPAATPPPSPPPTPRPPRSGTASKGASTPCADEIEETRFQVDQASLDAETRRQEEMASGAGTLIGVLFGGRRSTRSLSTAASKRSLTRKAEQRRAGAEARLTGKVEDLEALEDDLGNELTDIDAAWSAKAAAVETIEIALAKSDVTVDELAVVWLPVG